MNKRLGEKLYATMNLPKKIRDAISVDGRRDDSTEITLLFERVKRLVEDLIESGKPAVVDLSRRNGFNTIPISNYRTYNVYKNGVNNEDVFFKMMSGKNNEYRNIVESFQSWMKEEGLSLYVTDGHDGFGDESWSTLRFSPAPELVKELTDSKPSYSYKRR